MLECFKQDFDNDTYIIFHEDENENIFAFPDNSDPLDNLAVVGTVLKRIGVFHRDNPKVKDTDSLIRMGNVFPLICPRKATGNRSSVPLFDVFDRDNPILSFDLEPDLPQILMQQVAVFDQDNPRRNDKDKGLFT